MDKPLKVLTPDLMQRLEAVNTTYRLLKARGITVRAIHHNQGTERPVLVIRQSDSASACDLATGDVFAVKRDGYHNCRAPVGGADVVWQEYRHG